MKISVTRTQSPKPKPDPNDLGFGRYFTDHMFTMEYEKGKGWQNPQIIPYAPLMLDPASMVLHYGQEVFEGLKVYCSSNDDLHLFRPIENIRRFNSSNTRLSIPVIEEKLFMEAMNQLILFDRNWVPKLPDTSLYIRPFLFATDPYLGVRSSNRFMFVIIMTPVGAYYTGGMNPTKILVEDEDVRAVRGGIGFAKTGANYAATIRAQERAKEKGFTQILWLDAIKREYIEEVGTSNAFFVLDGTVITPPLQGSILPGITRDSCIQLLRAWDVPVIERQLSIDEIITAADSGKLDEAFTSGTAAVISPIGELMYKEKTLTIRQNNIGTITKRLYETLTGIQWGRLPDPFGWVIKIG